MGGIYELEGVRPDIAAGAYVHPDAVIIGDVVIAAGCFVGPSACLRGDLGRILMGEGSNVQDCCVMHTFPDEASVLGENSTVGHGAVLHGCRVGANVLVGMKAVIMDGAEIGENSIVAAMAFVRKGFKSEAGSLIAGIPADVVRRLKASEVADRGTDAMAYQHLTKRYRRGLRRI